MSLIEGDSVLLVDHSNYLSNKFCDGVASHGFEIHLVNSASECLDFLENNEISAIISRHRLPDLNGVRLLRSVRIIYPNIPFVLAPKDGSEKIASEAIDAGVTRYIADDNDTGSAMDRVVDSLSGSTPWADEERNRRYQHLIEVSPVPINLFDQTGESIWCNEATLDLLGLDSRDKLIGNSIFEFIHPDDHELAEEEIERVTEQKKSVGPTQMKLRRADGEIRYIYVSTAIGQFLGEDIGQAIAVDVTQLREVQEKLQGEQEFIDTALDSLEDIFYVVNENSELLRWNEATTEITGINENQMAGMQVTEFFADEDKDRITDFINSVIETGSDRVEAKIVDRNGQHVLFEFRGQRLPDSSETGGVRVAGVGRDISAQKEREHQSQILERWLRHNIRNDLTLIRGWAERIQQAEDSDPAELASQIVDRSNHLVAQADKEREIVNLITRSPSRASLSVGPLVERQVNLCRERHPSAEIELAEMDGFKAMAISELDLAIEELIDNAIEHNDSDPPRVQVAVVSNQETGAVRIADNGPGIPQMEVDELFPNQEIDQIHHGSGIGLFLVYWVVRHSDGQISIFENSPCGTIVELTFPVA